MPRGRRSAPACAHARVRPARTRARPRLVGAAVLVGLGVIGFPLLFETQPRPIAVDIPIEIPSRDGAPPLSLPPPQPASAAASRPAEPVLAERKELARALDDDARFAEMQIESLPPSPAKAVQELSEYQWRSGEAEHCSARDSRRAMDGPAGVGTPSP